LSSSPALPKPITLYLDADACPVKQEIYRVVSRPKRQSPGRPVSRDLRRNICYSRSEG